MGESQVIEPWIALWTPFVVFAVASMLLFWRVSTRIPGTLSMAPFGPLARMVGTLAPKLASRKEESE
jgi:hypothetical protein